MKARGIKVLVVDDSSVVRQYLTDMLSKEPSIAEVHSVPDGHLALPRIRQMDPDVVTLDIEMPQMDGLTTLQEIMREAPRPVIMLSAFAEKGAMKTVRALELGAVDFIRKPSGDPREIESVRQELVTRIEAVAGSRKKIAEKYAHRAPRRAAPAVRPSAPRGRMRLVKPVVLAIGASTGGVEAISQIIGGLPPRFPAGIVIVQHMPAGFTRSFAERLNSEYALDVKEAEHRDVILPGRVLIAPGHSHMEVRADDNVFYVELHQEERVSGHRPSVDVLLSSVTQAVGERAIGVVLTGMGQDGARGLLNMRQGGALTVAQDAASSVVFGMPKAAADSGAAELVVSLDELGELLASELVPRVSSRPPHPVSAPPFEK